MRVLKEIILLLYFSIGPGERRKKQSFQKRFLLFSLVILFIPGCVTVEETIYLGDAKVNAPLMPPPTHLNINKKTGDVTVSAKFLTITNNTRLKGTTDNRYKKEFKLNDTTFYRTARENLEWNLFNYTIGMDIDVKLSKLISLFGGINTSFGEDINLAGGNIGIGFHNDMVNPVTRFDIGINIQKYDYFAVSVVHTKTTTIFGTEEHYNIFDDKGSSVNINPFMSLTVCSSDETSFINYFGIIGIFSQSLLDFEPGETGYAFFPFVATIKSVDERAGFISYSLYANPGLSFSLGENTRFVLSGKLIKELSNSSQRWLFMPAAQMDFQL